MQNFSKRYQTDYLHGNVNLVAINIDDCIIAENSNVIHYDPQTLMNRSHKSSNFNSKTDIYDPFEKYNQSIDTDYVQEKFVDDSGLIKIENMQHFRNNSDFNLSKTKNLSNTKNMLNSKSKKRFYMPNRKIGNCLESGNYCKDILTSAKGSGELIAFKKRTRVNNTSDLLMTYNTSKDFKNSQSRNSKLLNTSNDEKTIYKDLQTKKELTNLEKNQNDFKNIITDMKKMNCNTSKFDRKHILFRLITTTKNKI